MHAKTEASSISRFFIAFLFLILTILLQAKIVSAPFVLGTLIAAGFFLNVIELLPLALIAFYVLNVQPVMNTNAVFLIATPFAAYLLRRILPWEKWLSFGITLTICMLLFYFSFGVPFGEIFPLFIRDLIFVMIFGAINYISLAEIH